MSKTKLLLIMAVLTAGGLLFYACNKTAHNAPARVPGMLAAQMAKDKDVQEFVTVIHQLQAAINLDFGKGQVIGASRADTLVSQAVRHEQLAWLAKKGNELGNRYHLDQYGNIARHELFGDVFDLIRADRSLAGKRLQHRTAKGMGAGRTERAATLGCTDWYFVTINTITNEVVDETYLYTTCDEQNGNQVPQPDLSGGGPEVVLNTPVTCEEEWQLKKERCERNAKIDVAVAFVTAGVLVLISDGALAPGVAVGYGSAITKMALTYNNCVNDAADDYNRCVEKRKTTGV